MEIPLLDPEAVAKGEALGLLARGIVEGYRVGEHRSPFQGFAIEFAQHREYGIGDDLKHLDWKLLGKTDRLYIKQYEQDTNFVANILVDASESMTYASGNTSKLEYAKVLAACLAHIILQQRDSVALDIFDTGIREHMKPTDNPGRIHEIMTRLAAFQGVAGTKLGQVLQDVASMAKFRGIVIVISDLFDEEEAIQRGIERLRFQGTETVIFHVLDPYELTFPLKGSVHFRGLEGYPDLMASPEAIRNSYLESFDAFRGRMRRACEVSNAHYVLADTSVPVGETLGAYLAFRHKVTAR